MFVDILKYVEAFIDVKKNIGKNSVLLRTDSL